MLVPRNWRQFAATLKAIFTGKTTPAKTIALNTKITHRKLRIPDAREQQGVRVHKQRSMSDTLID